MLSFLNTLSPFYNPLQMGSQNLEGDLAFLDNLRYYNVKERQGNISMKLLLFR